MASGYVSNKDTVGGRRVSRAAPTNAYALVWNASLAQWEPQAQSGGGGGSFTAGGDLTGDATTQTVVSLTGSSGVVIGPATALTLGAAPRASAGHLRGPATFSAKARKSDDLSDLNVFSFASDVLTIGGSANVGVVIGTSTGNTIKAQVNAADVAAVSSTGVAVTGAISATTTVTAPTALLVGATPRASAGTVRGPLDLSILARNSSDNGDINIATLAANVLTYGGTVNSGVVIGTSTGNTVAAQVNGTARLTVSGSAVALGSVPLQLQGATVAASGDIRGANATTLIAVKNQAGSADIAVLGTNTSNQIVIAGINSGSVRIESGGAQRFVVSSTDTVATVPMILQGTNRAQSGDIRAANATTIIGARNQANGGDLAVLATDTSNRAVLGDATALAVRLNVATQTTVGAAGGASALPATPSIFAKVNIAGTDYVFPGYAVS